MRDGLSPRAQFTCQRAFRVVDDQANRLEISMVQAIDVAAVPVAEDLHGICSTLIIGQLPGTCGAWPEPT